MGTKRKISIAVATLAAIIFWMTKPTMSYSEWDKISGRFSQLLQRAVTLGLEMVKAAPGGIARRDTQQRREEAIQRCVSVEPPTLLIVSPLLY